MYSLSLDTLQDKELNDASLLSIHNDGVELVTSEMYLIEELSTCTDVLSTITTEGISPSISISIPGLTPIASFFEFIQKIFRKLIVVFSDFIGNVMTFTRSKIFQQDNYIFTKKYKYIETYYNSSDIVKCKFRKYNVDKPDITFLNDFNNFYDFIEIVTSETEKTLGMIKSKTPSIIDKILHSNNKTYIKRILDIKKKYVLSTFDKNKVNIELIDKINPYEIVYQKYFNGDIKVSNDDINIKDVITSKETFKKILPYEAYTKYMNIRKNCTKNINSTLTLIDNLNKAFEDTTEGKLVIDLELFRNISADLNELKLTMLMLFKLTFAFWKLHYIVSDDMRRAVYAIINHYEELL